MPTAHSPKGTALAASRLEDTESQDTTQGLSHSYPNWPVSWRIKGLGKLALGQNSFINR